MITISNFNKGIKPYENIPKKSEWCYGRHRFCFIKFPPTPKITLLDNEIKTKYKLNEAEETFRKHYNNRSYKVYRLSNCGADFLLEKNKEYTILEVKTTISKNNVSDAIVQLLYAKDILEKDYNINNSIIGCMFESENKNMKAFVKACDRYLKHFEIKIKCLYGLNMFATYKPKKDSRVPECFEEYNK